MSTRNLYDLTRKHLRLFACQKQDNFCNILWLNQLTHRNNRYDDFGKIIINPTCLSRTWSHTIHGNAILCYFKGDAACECCDASVERLIILP